MAGVVARAVAVLVGGFDLSCYLTSIDPKADQDLKDNTALCTTGDKTFAVGLANRTVSGEGFFAANAVDDTLSIDKAFNDAFSVSVDKLVTIGQLGSTPGNPAILMNTKQAKYDVKEKVGDLLMTTAEFQVTERGTQVGYGRGIWLYQATVTGAATGAGVDNAIGTTGWLCNAHNTDADGTASFKVQHSNDNSTWVDLFSFILARNNAAQSSDTTTPVRRYLRVVVTSIGGTTSKISVGIKAGYTG